MLRVSIFLLMMSRITQHSKCHRTDRQHLNYMTTVYGNQRLGAMATDGWVHTLDVGYMKVVYQFDNILHFNQKFFNKVYVLLRRTAPKTLMNMLLCPTITSSRLQHHQFTTFTTGGQGQCKGT